MPRPGHLYTAHALAGALWFLAVAVCPVSAAAPTVSSYITPSDNAVGVSESTSLIVQFDQNVVKGSSGNITVYKYSDDSTVETIAIDSASAPGNAFVTITLSTLDYGTRYYIFIDNTAIENGSSEAFAGISDKDTWDFTTKDNDGTLVASATVNEPIAVASTVTTTVAAVDIFDFTLTDGGSTDGMALAVTQIVLNTSGTGPFSKVTFRLNGPDAANVTGTYNSGTNTLTSSSLSISVADNTSETYTVNAYYNDNTALTENQTLILSVDGDTDLTVSGTGTQMGATTAVTNATGSAVAITATELVFTTQPAPLSLTSGTTLDFTTDPVVEARDANGIKDTGFTDTITLTETGRGTATYTNNAVSATAGVATFTSMTVTYIATANAETFALQADNTACGSEGDITTLPTSSSITAYTLNTDGALTAASGITEPMALPSTAISTSAAVDIFDFTLTDGGSSDGFALAVTQVVLNTSGTGPFSKVTFRLNGPDAANVTGTYNSGTNNLTFSSLSISVADNTSETYTVNAYYNDNTALTENQTLILSFVGDTDLTVSGTGTQMGATTAVTNASGSTIAITATQLVLTIQPADTRQVDAADEVLNGSAFQTPPIIRAHDAAGNLDVDFVDQSSGAEGDLSAIASTALSADVVATQSVFTRNPDAVLSGLIAGTQPEVQARDARGITDRDFTQPATLTLNASDSIENATATASAGVAAFTGLKITGASQVVFDGQPKALLSATDPADLAVVPTYNGSNTAPSGPGSYEVIATINDAIYAGTASGSLTIHPPAAPTAGLEVSTTEGPAPLTVAFTDISQGFGYTFFEVFDSANQTFDNPGTVEVTDADPGTYEAVLTIRGQGGTDQTRVAITVHGPPSLGQTIAAPAAAPAGQTQFLDLSGLDPQDGTWAVDLIGSGPIAHTEIDGERVSFIPDAALHGTQAVKITRTNAWGLSISQQLVLAWTAPVPDPHPPTAPDSPLPTSPSADNGTTNDDAQGATGTADSAATPLADAPADGTAAPPHATPDANGVAALPNDTAETTPPTDANGGATTASAPTTTEAPSDLPAPDTNGDSSILLANDGPTGTNPVAPPLANDDATLLTSEIPAGPDANDLAATNTFFDAAGQPVYGLFNQDLRVDLNDYFLFADQYGTATGQPGYDPRFDLDGDGQVGLSDFFLFADSFGKEAVAP